MGKKLLFTIIFLIVIFLLFLNLPKTNHSNDQIIYIPNFLSESEYQMIKQSIQEDQRPFRINWNNLQTKPLKDDIYHQLFYSPQSLSKVQQYTGNTVQKSIIPPEYRIYSKHKGMDWHTDTLLYKEPQYECVYTIENTSDSTTDYLNQKGQLHSVRTEPNSLMLVKANGYMHRVKPVNRGKRTIIKLIYTTTQEINPKNTLKFHQALHSLL